MTTVEVTLNVDVGERSWASYFGHSDAYDRAEAKPSRSLVADVRDYVTQAVVDSPASRDKAIMSVECVDDARRQSSTGEMILLLDPSAQAGRTGYRFKVKDAQRTRAIVRDALGTTRSDTPSTVEILRAAKALSALLFDATEGDARLMVQLGKRDDVEMHSPAAVLGTIS